MAKMGIFHDLCNSYGKLIIRHWHRYSYLFPTIGNLYAAFKFLKHVKGVYKAGHAHNELSFV